MEKNKKTKRSYRRLIDLFFLLILLIVCIYAFYKAFNFSMLPAKYTTMALAVTIVVYLILLILALKKMPTWFVVIKRIFIILLCAILATTSHFMKKVEVTTEKIATVNSSSKTKLFVLTRSDSTIESLQDLQHCIVGYQSGSDMDSANYMQEVIQKEAPTSQATTFIDYTTLYYMLINGKIDALAISEQYYGMTRAVEEDFDKNVKIIHTFQKPPVQVEHTLDTTKDVFTIYVSGIDNAGSPDQQARSDVNLIMIVNPKNNHIDMVSLPRDALVPNPALSYYNDKLTHTSLHGIQNSIDAIEHTIGVPIDYYARVSFTSVAQIVDAVGGVNVDVELDVIGHDETKRRATDENQDYSDLPVIRVDKGDNQHLNGAQALLYARHRKTEGYGTEGRERAQRKIILGVINQLLSLNAFNYISNILDVAPNFVVTNMPSDQITSFINAQLANVKPWTIHSLVSDAGIDAPRQVASLDPTYGPYDTYLFSKEEIHGILNAYDGAKKAMNLSSFSFDLNNLYEHTPQIEHEDEIEWSNNAPEAMY